MSSFDQAFDKTMQHEGEYSFHRQDPGGETYMGISRVYWPSWPGWRLINREVSGKKLPDNYREVLAELVKLFYRTNFWNQIQGDKLAKINQDVAEELFDTSVNLGVQSAVIFLQTSLNMQRQYNYIYPKLVQDGLLGSLTIKALELYLETQPGSHENNKKILLACLNGEQYLHYKANPLHKYFRGWFLRT